MENHISSIVGIDVSKAHLDAHELPSGRSAPFRNDTVGLRELAAWIGPRAQPRSLRVHRAMASRAGGRRWRRGFRCRA